MTDFFDRLEAIMDLGQKRYLMNREFERIIRSEIPDETEEEEVMEHLESNEGYLYKLSQDFLTASSTLEKKRKLKKIKEYQS